MSLVLPSCVTQADARTLAEGLVRAVTALAQQGQRVELDATQLQYFDSSMLAVLLACRRAAHRHGQSLVVLGLPPKARSLVAVYGLTALLP